MDAGRATVRAEGRVLEVLHHDAVVALAVPRLGLVRPRAHVVPYRLRGGREAVGRHRIVHDDVAVLVPEREIVRRQHGRARVHGGEPLRDISGVGRAGDSGVDARCLQRRDRPAGFDDPLLESLERRRGGKQILHRLLEPDAERVDEQMIEMLLALVDGQLVPGASGGVARPQALELIDAQRTRFRRGRQVDDLSRGGLRRVHRASVFHRLRPRHARVPPLPAVERPRGPGR